MPLRIKSSCTAPHSHRFRAGTDWYEIYRFCIGFAYVAYLSYVIGFTLSFTASATEVNNMEPMRQRSDCTELSSTDWASGGCYKQHTGPFVSEPLTAWVVDFPVDAGRVVSLLARQPILSGTRLTRPPIFPSQC